MSNTPTPRRGSVLFLMISTLTLYAGTSTLIPVLPSLVEPYTAEADRALVIGLLLAVFSLAQFLASPVIGALSDRFGRRPVLYVSLFGTVIGYLLLGIGGALWVLFLGRIIDGITGGATLTINAYAADITEEKDRTRFFGQIGAVGGIGLVFGPAVGALIFSWTHDPLVVVYALAALTAANLVWGIFTLDEGLPADRRSDRLSLTCLNPFSQFSTLFQSLGVRSLLMAAFLFGIAGAVIHANVSYFVEDLFGWTITETSIALLVAGGGMVIGQALFVKRLLPILGEARLAIFGFSLFGICLLFFVWMAVAMSPGLIYIALICGGIGIGTAAPAINGMLSLSAHRDEQGRMQGAQQSVQSLARMAGPVWAGIFYSAIGAGAPYFSGVILLIAAGWLVSYGARSAVTFSHAHAVGD